MRKRNSWVTKTSSDSYRKSLIRVGDFNYLHICCKDNIGHNQVSTGELKTVYRHSEFMTWISETHFGPDGSQGFKPDDAQKVFPNLLEKLHN